MYGLFTILLVLSAPLMGQGWFSLHWLYLLCGLYLFALWKAPIKWPVRALLAGIALSVMVDNVGILSKDQFIAGRLQRLWVLSELGAVTALFWVPRKYFRCGWAFVVLYVASWVARFYQFHHIVYLLPCAAIIAAGLVEEPYDTVPTLLAFFLIVGNESTTVYAAVGAMLFAWHAQKANKKLAVALGVSLVLLGAVVVPNYLGASDRWNNYALFIHHWVTRGPSDVFLGMGAGTFTPWAKAIADHYKMNEYFHWAHSDWLQILIEQGIIGLLGALYFFAWALHTTWKKQPGVARSILVFGVVMLSYFPLRHGLCFVLGLTILRMIGGENVPTNLGRESREGEL